MKLTLAGSWICWMLRRHTWRRLRKGEWKPDRINTATRICDRCGIMRAVKPRQKVTP